MAGEHLVRLLQITGAALGIPAAAAGTFAAYQSYFSTDVTCRYCCKSRRGVTVEFKFETIESGRAHF
jgi:hypothetical protein